MLPTTPLRLNHLLPRARRLLHMPGYRALAGYAKRKVKKAVGFIFDFGDSMAHDAQLRGVAWRGVAWRGVDGVICGHIHWASDRRIGKVRYLNCGDWVDSCSAVVEYFDCRLEVMP